MDVLGVNVVYVSYSIWDLSILKIMVWVIYHFVLVIDTSECIMETLIMSSMTET